MAIFTTKTGIFSILLFGLFPLITHAADCQYMPNVNPENVLIRSLDEITVDPILPVGSVIKRIYGSFYNDSNKAFVTCQSKQAEYRWRNSHQYPIHNNETIYPTNLAGIGLKIIYHDGNIQSSVAPCYAKVFCAENLYKIEVQLIKTAQQVESGDIPSQQLTEATIGNLPIVSFQLADTKIIAPKPSCSLDNKNLTVNLGHIKQSAFKGLNSTAGDTNFQLRIICTHLVNMNMKIQGSHVVTKEIFGLNDSSSPDTAQGVGLQILYWELGTGQQFTLPDNFFIQLSNTEGTEPYYNVPFIARYIQIADQIKPGRANATVTLYLHYN